jgi:hypothetical protein
LPAVNLIKRPFNFQDVVCWSGSRRAAQGARDFGGGEISVTPIFCQAK